MKKKYFALLVCLILCSFLSATTRAQNSTPLSISSQGSINYPSPNLASIPDDWENYKSQGYLAHGTGPQIVFVDSDVVRTTGKPSIRIEPHTTADLNTARECDGIWYPVKPGDHIIAESWMRVLTGPSTNGYPRCGARIGIDFYASTLLPATAFWTTYFGGDFSKGYVQDSNGGTWQKRVLDFIVPATVGDSGGNPQVPTSIVLWLQGAPWSVDSTATTVWFADPELYINP